MEAVDPYLVPNIHLTAAIWRWLVSWCDGFGCFVQCDSREGARVDAVQQQFTRLELDLSLSSAPDERERDLARFGLSRYFLSPAQWNIIWGDKAGITHNFLVFSPEQHGQPARGVCPPTWESGKTELHPICRVFINFHECNMRHPINVAAKYNGSRFEQTNEGSGPVNYHASESGMNEESAEWTQSFVCLLIH